MIEMLSPSAGVNGLNGMKKKATQTRYKTSKDISSKKIRFFTFLFDNRSDSLEKPTAPIIDPGIAKNNPNKLTESGEMLNGGLSMYANARREGTAIMICVKMPSTI